MRRVLPQLHKDEEPVIRRRLRSKSNLIFIDKVELDLRISTLLQNDVHIDTGLLLRLILKVNWALTRACLDDDSKPLVQNGLKVFYLVEPGCRVRFEGQKELSVSIGVSVSHLKEQIRIFKQIDIVVATGHGWMEFDARVVWQGDLELRDIYIEWQRENLPSSTN